MVVPRCASMYGVLERKISTNEPEVYRRYRVDIVEL
jgi:hypothetical protein